MSQWMPSPNIQAKREKLDGLLRYSQSQKMLSTIDVSSRLAAAVLAGVLVGVNREMHAKAVGVRTLGLVSLGSALVTLAGSGFSSDLMDANASRAIQGIVTGIGFLGAGVIVKGESQMHVHGLTTAAAIWVTAALGIACGVGAYVPVGVGLGLMVFLLSFGGFLDRAVAAFSKGKRDAGPSDGEDSKQVENEGDG